MGENVTISGFRLEEYDRAIELWNHCEGIGLSNADSRESIQIFLDRNPNMSFVAYKKNELIGAVLCGHDGRRGYIYHLAVHPGYRNQGVGRMLIEKCVVALESAGIQKSHLFIFKDNNEGIKFWVKVGWSKRSDISVFSRQIASV
jgi:ribosomal protein S18 acetylase RimI-like enzyme